MPSDQMAAFRSRPRCEGVFWRQMVWARRSMESGEKNGRNDQENWQDNELPRMREQ